MSSIPGPRYDAPGNLQGGVPGPALNFDGGYVQASYSIGGTRHYDPTRGLYGVIPERPMAPGSSGWGALELAARYTLVTSTVLPDDCNARARLFRAGCFHGRHHQLWRRKETTYGVGLNWYPTTT